jgi:tRNA (Thr-GGU) A37 N-methylase
MPGSSSIEVSSKASATCDPATGSSSSPGSTGRSATCCADRPNPIGLHEVEILAIDGHRIRVANLEALHGTPILDLKPVL